MRACRRPAQRPARPGLEFALFAVLVTLAIAPATAQGVALWRDAGTPMILA